MEVKRVLQKQWTSIDSPHCLTVGRVEAPGLGIQ